MTALGLDLAYIASHTSKGTESIKNQNITFSCLCATNHNWNTCEKHYPPVSRAYLPEARRHHARPVVVVGQTTGETEVYHFDTRLVQAGWRQQNVLEVEQNN